MWLCGVVLVVVMMMPVVPNLPASFVGCTRRAYRH
jgi:hypothetical protein